MANLKSKTVMVYDYGQFVEFSIRLSRDFGRTLYFAPWVEEGYPTSRILRIGEGIEGVERVTEIWSHLDDIDLIVFPDAYEPDLQEYLASLGKRVWGCRQGAELELDRKKTKEIAKGLGIDVPPYRVVTGLDALRRHLKSHDDQWVKISVTRGDMETFHSANYEAAEQRLDELEHNLGAKKKEMEFLVEEGINPAVEVGYDGFTIDGKFARGAIVGVEVKDQSYVGRTLAYRDLPEGVKSVNEKLAPALKRYGYRGFLSTEVRCTPDGKAYLIDPCARAGSPPSEIMMEMIGNLSEILWEGASGTVVEPEFTAKWGAMIVVDSEWAKENWQHVRFPPKLRDKIKLRHLTVIDGEHYTIPQGSGHAVIGGIIGLGDSADAAIADCRKTADQFEGHQIDKPVEALDKAKDELAKILGDKMSDKTKSKTERRADDARSRGQISQGQYDKRMGAEA